MMIEIRPEAIAAEIGAPVEFVEAELALLEERLQSLGTPSPPILFYYFSLRLRQHLEPERVHLRVEQVRRAGREPSILIGVMAPDWSGLVDGCVGVLHDEHLSLEGLLTEVIHREGRAIRVIFAYVRGKEETSPDVISHVKVRLVRAASPHPGKGMLLRLEALRLEKYAQVVEVLLQQRQNHIVGEPFIKESEVLRFFASRSAAYLSERTPPDLARQILTNYNFVELIRLEGGIYDLVENLTTTQGDLTGITVGGYGEQVSLGDCLRVLHEVVPDFQRKYDKVFVTPDRINVIRIEICNQLGHAYEGDKLTEIREALKEIGTESSIIDLSPGVELLVRKIIPGMLEEERLIRIPHVYMYPHSRSRVKVVLVSSGDAKGHGPEAMVALNDIPGFSAALDMPDLIGYQDEDDFRAQEVTVIDVWVDFPVFFGKTKGPFDEDEIFHAIEEVLHRVSVIGPELRVFDKTSRLLRKLRTDRILAKAEDQGVDSYLARRILSRMGDHILLSGTVTDSEIAQQVVLGSEVLLQSMGLDGTGRVIRVKELPRRNGHVEGFLAVVGHLRGRSLVGSCIEKFRSRSMSIRFVARVDVSGRTLLFFRLGPQNDSLSKGDTEKARKDIETCVLDACEGSCNGAPPSQMN